MDMQASKPLQLQRRLIVFAGKIVSLSFKLRRTAVGRHIANQMVRCGTATAANYGEARAAESRSDFIHKLRIVLKELNETDVWLQLILETSLVDASFVDAIVAENQELAGFLPRPSKHPANSSPEDELEVADRKFLHRIICREKPRLSPDSCLQIINEAMSDLRFEIRR
jgi:four helix bundle protein